MDPKNKDNSSDRRREQRIEAKNSVFVTKMDGVEFICKVVNLSQLGLGIEMPEALMQNAAIRLMPGAVIEGELRVGRDSLKASAIVRVQKDSFLGLEYQFEKSSFLTQLKKLLTPQYIASSIYKIDSKFLSQDIESAYRGNEFECLVFKGGLSAAGSAVQFFATGKFVEVVGDKARVVPFPLVRTAGGEGNLDFLLEFAKPNESQNKNELKSFFAYVDGIISNWDECPQNIKSIVEKQLSH